MVYNQQGRHAEALPLLRRALERAAPDLSVRPKLHLGVGRAAHGLGDLDGALTACREGLREAPGHPELLFQEGLILLDKGDPGGAEAAVRGLLAGPDRQQFGSLDLGLRTYKGRHLLGEALYRQGRAGEAEEEWQACLAARPDFGPAWSSMADLLRDQGRWEELEAACVRLSPWAPARAALHRIEGMLAGGKVHEAGLALEPILASHPKAVRPRVLRSRILIQEGRDRETVEAALRAVLEVDSGNEEARRNLDRILGNGTGQ